MTDEEIIKAREICLSPGIPCDDCPLVEQPDCDEITRQYFYKRFKELKAENAALRERLDKAVELPVKLGDPVYYLQYFCDYKGCDRTTQQFCCGCKEMIKREKSKEYYVIREKPFELKDLPKIGKKYFTTCDAAEARLKELQGGKQ